MTWPRPDICVPPELLKKIEALMRAEFEQRFPDLRYRASSEELAQLFPPAMKANRASRRARRRAR